ncbi:hypothetical protein ES319_A13G100300v1 [Gossypium barbadense]|uniref:Uncharacterized protein n=1 Tax=Gossypium barbadense TaxID=3634 RepID=A0A5J5SX37_GOSBA|nr:hypothetical protein ES319_A13G100300v1 [Gossypium barbadense]
MEIALKRAKRGGSHCFKEEGKGGNRKKIEGESLRGKESPKKTNKDMTKGEQATRKLRSLKSLED